MRTLVNILSLVSIIFCIGFFDSSTLDEKLDTNILLIQQHCNVDTTSTKLNTKLDLELNSFYQHEFWSKKAIDSCDQKELLLLLEQIVENNFSTHKINAGRLATLKESLTCKN